MPYLCRQCRKRFNERTHTPMARLRTAPAIVAAAINVRSEGLGVRATGRSFAKSHSTIINWERRLAGHIDHWSPPAPAEADVTLEGDEVYTRVGQNLPPVRAKAVSANYPHRKVWRFGLEVAMKVKGSQGRRRVVWVKAEHPYTAMSLAHDVHANHNEAQNSAIRRRASAYRRRQNLYCM